MSDGRLRKRSRVDVMDQYIGRNMGGTDTR